MTTICGIAKTSHKLISISAPRNQACMGQWPLMARMLQAYTDRQPCGIPMDVRRDPIAPPGQG